MSHARVAGLVVLLAASSAAARPNTNGAELYHYAVGEVVESFNSAGGSFKIWFTRAGVDAVGSDDLNLNGTPDDVEEVAALYDEVLGLYQTLGYRQPVSDAGTSDNGGDGRFDVYLLDFGGGSDGSFRQQSCDADNVCSGFMVHENDFAGYGYPSRTYANRVLASHEFFHAVQAAYDAGENGVFAEGTAVWATERFDPTLNDLEGFVGGYLSRPDHSLYLPLPGPVDAFSYGTAIFFQFLSEKYGDTVIRELWEASVGAPDWFSAIDGVLVTHGSSFAEAFFTFARWNWFTGARANPALGYARGKGYALVTREADVAPLTVTALRVFPAATGYFGLPPAGRAQMDVSLVVPAGVDGAPLRLAVAVRRGTAVSEPIVADASLRVSAATDGADELLVLVSNTAQSGESLKPGMCVGAPTEVDACRVQLGVAPPSMGNMPGGCALAAQASPTAPWWLLALLLAALARRACAAR